MIAEFLKRDVVLRLMEDLKDLPADDDDRRDPDSVSSEDAAKVTQEVTAALGRERKKPSGPRSYPVPHLTEEQPPPIEERAFISSDPTISLVQSALDELYQQPENAKRVRQAGDADRRADGAADPVTDLFLVKKPPEPDDDERRLFDKFSVTDLQWVRSKLAEGIRLFRGKHKFNAEAAKPATIPGRARLVLVGDWGSGLPRARAVADWMRTEIEKAQAEGVATHVIHLGDVYYSGWGHEYERRFLPYWPVTEAEAGTIGSWNINGNHDMYSGGHAYFDVGLADPRFAPWQSNQKGPSSFFSLANDHWKILGLDSSWDDGGLKDPQAKWLAAELASAGKRKTLLLSHHQYVSAYESGAKKLIAKATPILEAHPVTAWFWGHEHRCMLYKKNPEVAYGRCLGDGGVPVYQWHQDADPVKAPGFYEQRHVVMYGLEQWARMGFAVLDFIGDHIDVRYIDELGKQHAKETIT